MFLTDEEIIELTGYKLAAYQIQWLRDHQFTYVCTRLRGKPRVLRTHVEQRLGAITAVAVMQDEPDFSKWEGNHGRTS